MNWKIEWREKDGVATHASGASFFITREGWITVQGPARQSDGTLKALMAELHGVLANVAQKSDAIH